MNARILAFALVLIALSARTGATHSLGAQTWHVAVSGSDTNPGTLALPFRTVQRAVDAAGPGNTILVHGGTYDGVVEIRTAGTPGAPIVLAAAGDGTALLRASLPGVSCAATAPTPDRTLRVTRGADYWTITGLQVAGGIGVAGDRTAGLQTHLGDLTLPGRGPYDPEAAATLLESLGADGADHIRILRNRVTGRGIQVTAGRYGEISDNEVFNIDCGTGAGIGLNLFSDGWVIRSNFVHNAAESVEHWMSEGIRQAAESNYNLVEKNTVQDLAGRGRGITTDVYSSWNVIRRNVVRRAEQGFNNQTGGWGNQWLDNWADSNRKSGFNIDGKDGKLAEPDNGVPYELVMKGNCSIGNPTDLNAGAVNASAFDDNAFTVVYLSANLRRYWSDYGNTWEGGSEPPPYTLPEASCEAPAPTIFTDAELFVKQQYRDIFGREGDAGGVAAWTGGILSGTLSRVDLVQIFLQSGEFQSGTVPVTRLFFAMHGRGPSFDEILHWTDQFHSGTPLFGIAAAFADDPEFHARYDGLGNADFVAEVYRSVLGRTAEPAALAGWTAQLGNGLARSTMVALVAGSPEYQARSRNWILVTHMYVNLLRRTPDAGGFQAWVGYLAGGSSFQALIRSFLDSAEYHRRFEG